MKASTRTWLSIALFVPLAVILLGTFACLPVPIGDPAKSKIDPALTGVYRAVPANPADKVTELAILRPWDERTYLLEYLQSGIKDGKEVRQIQHFRAWITIIADKTFITAEPADDLRFAFGDDGSKPYWVVLRVDQVPGGLEVRMVKPDSEYLKNATKREDFEAAIKAHVSDVPLYTDTLSFKKLGKEDQAQVDEVLSKFDTSHTAK